MWEGMVAFAEGEETTFSLWTVDDYGHAEVFAIPIPRGREVTDIDDRVSKFLDTRHEHNSFLSFKGYPRLCDSSGYSEAIFSNWSRIVRGEPDGVPVLSATASNIRCFRKNRQ